MSEPVKFSKSEIALHSSKKDCWVVINGKVYDVTSFLEEHPGGEEPLLHSSAAGDATQAFEDVGHSDSAVNMMRKFLIGSVEGQVAQRGEASKPAATSAQKKPPQRPPPPSSSIFEFLVPISIIVLALAAYYYFNYYSKEVQA